MLDDSWVWHGTGEEFAADLEWITDHPTALAEDDHAYVKYTNGRLGSMSGIDTLKPLCEVISEGI